MLSIIIPAHNEALRISQTLEEYTNYFSARFGSDFEILVVPNHCSDNTADVVARYSPESGQVRIRNVATRGKGHALRVGFQEAKGDILAFTDADGATPPQELDKLISNLGQHDGVIASRWLPQSVKLPELDFIRILTSRGWNLLVRTILGLPYKDTQCGAKVFTRTAVIPVLPVLTIDGFAFDIELLYRMKLQNRAIKEVPITWYNKKGSTLNLIRCIPEMLRDLIKIKRSK